MSELIDRERFSADMRDFQNRVGIWRDEAEDTETWTRADAALATIIETKLILDKQPTIAAPRWHRVEEPPKEGTWCVIAKHSYLQPHNLFYDIAHYLHGTFSVYDSGIGDWFDGKPLYWMPIEPPKEDA